MRKRLAYVLLMLLCVVNIVWMGSQKITAAVSESNGDITITGKTDNQDQLVQIIESAVQQWQSINWADEVKQEEESSSPDQAILEQHRAWETLQTNAGVFSKIDSIDFEDAKDSAVNAKAVVSFEKGKIQFDFVFQNGSLTDVKLAAYQEETKPLGETMRIAGINTVMSICIVFAVLLFIALIISLFAFIPKIEQCFKGTKAPIEEKATVVEESPAQIETDDTELVAVITAAIVASMGDAAPTDGLRITSIKRRNTNRW